ncbi:MAG TPA: HAMP domain-containing sensor histidine kinase [Gaiellaceae bacterium]|jgi:two-component system sensor histidine kinase MprB|nr:HAMP domain-containing sensor histidine kinase [Gaiellaceae bacterium]
MTFRARLIVAAAVAVAVAVAAASFAVYFIVRGELRGSVDRALRARIVAVEGLNFVRLTPSGVPGKFWADIPPPLLGGAGGYIQLVQDNGNLARPEDEDIALPAGSHAQAVASEGGGYFQDATVEGTHVRILTDQLTPGWAVQVARPLTEVDHSLARIRFWLFFVALSGVGIAAALGLAVARTALAPVRRLTDTAEHVTETRDLSSRIDADGRDELSRLAASFNTMLAALEQSVDAQRQLVADASHELRTPLTSLRTNIDVLARRGDKLAPEERERLLADVAEQLAEMSALVAELVELARGEQQPHEPEDVRLDLLVQHAVERARRNAPNVEFETSAEPSIVHGVPASIERAVGNLLDNAAKWSPPGGRVDVSVANGKVVVRDRGPGIEDEDIPHVFDRFYRAPTARGRPGSGLGLAIVKQVADAHGGEVTVGRPDDGGTRIELALLDTS